MADETEAPNWEEQVKELQAKLEESKANSRKWEKLAKANKDASTQLEEAQTSKASADAKIAELTKRLDEKEAAEKRAKIAAKVAQEKGVPADLLVGEDEEQMGAWADKMTAAFKKPAAASVPNAGKFASGQDKSALEETRKALFG